MNRKNVDSEINNIDESEINNDADESLLNFFESKKFRLVVNVVNLCLIAVLIISVICGYIKKSQYKEITANTTTVQIGADEAMKQAEETMTGVYYTLIKGMTGEYNGCVLKFGYNGDFSGYYDKNNTSVNDYYYMLTESSDEDYEKGYVANVIIYKDIDSGSVQYKLLFDDNQNMVLYHLDSKIQILLTD